ncbi:hypothetical protein ACQW02_16145 [Humitalea sp. 24SJ18S-53]|uniref:hypothetical protein n=1 Tax=Humitalea sp. 24SJ18S-53 TaxID=3422307 RepID=UPI003D6737F3
MSPDIPGLPPPGGALVLPCDIFSASHDDPYGSGINIGHDGRLAFCSGGVGLAVILPPEHLVNLGLVLIAIGEARSEAAGNAASEASANLARIVKAATRHA